MAPRFIVTEEEKLRIKLLYEQDDNETDETSEKINLLTFLKDNFTEIPNKIGSWGIKDNNNSFVVDLTLEQDGNSVKYLKFVVEPEHSEFVNSLGEEFKLPIVKTSTGEMVTRAPFTDVKVLEKINSKIKELNGDF